MAEKPSLTFKFLTMNNVKDPSDLSEGECVDIVNFDVDNDGGIATRPAYIQPLVQQPVSDINNLGGRSYFAVANTVRSSRALADDEDSRFSLVISLDDMVTMIKRVDGGLYVGSTKQLHFLSGTDAQVGGFQDVWALPWGVILGTGMNIKGEKVPVAELSGNCCIFASTQGVIVGGPRGEIRNLSQNKVSYPFGTVGKAAIVENKGIIQYLFTTSSENSAYNPYEPAFLSGLATESLQIKE